MYVVKCLRAVADSTGMGDTVRRLLYPLVLPFIVATVWAYALMMDGHVGPSDENHPADQAIAGWMQTFSPSPTRGGASTPEGYGFSRDADGFATIVDIDE